jgi:NAD(P)-dependent dehydrogenase (short-subunit alcohol dehydrogenase family)
MPKTILITGTSSGFGRDTAETIARAGHTVYASMRDVAGHNRTHAEALRAHGLNVLELDVTDDASVESAVGAVLATSGRIDVLVNNAAILAAGVSEAFTPDQATMVFDTNVVGLLRTARAVLPAMRQQGDGLIINIGSIVGRVTFPFFGIYGASKFAIEALTDSLRYELSQLGVDIILVQPSAYPTKMYASALQPGDAKRAQDYGETYQISGKMFDAFMGKLQGENAPNPHDVAEAVAKLVGQPKGSRPARTIVGQPFGADVVNQQTAPVQAQVVEGLGLGQLATLSGVAKAA